MSDIDRRLFLKGILSNLALATGTVVLASVAASTAQAQDNSSASANPPEDVQGRADRLAASTPIQNEETLGAANEFLNGGFRNTPVGSFRNGGLGGFRNTPVGRFRNTPIGGFRNTPLGTFGNAGWPNGGWLNGGWPNGAFRNGGWPNFGWGNW
jgi:hypothetical protein